MKTKLAKAVALVVALQASALHALGLGDISVGSSVNERFVAEIPIANARGLDKSQILVSLASSSDFTRAAIERPYYLSRLDFDVDTSSTNKVLRISTDDVILEPYLNFLLEVRWPNGRLLKEYMVLLDLPAYTAAPVKAIDAPTPNASDRGDNTRSKVPSAQRSSKTLPSSRANTTNASVSRERAPVDASEVASGSYTVQANQTLWDIGKASRADGETTTQAMSRVFQANPAAFVNGDINRLIKGAVLRIPATSTLLSNEPAVVNTQLVTRDSSLAALKDANQALSSSASAPPVSQQSNDNGLLTLSAAEVSENNQAASYASAIAATEASEMESKVNNTPAAQSQYNSTADIAQLENDLARSFESLDRAKLENAGLEQRVEGIQQQFTDLERLIALKDQELAALKQSITQGANVSDADLALAAATQTSAATTTANTNEPSSVVDKLASALSLTGTAFLLIIGAVVALVIALGWWLLSPKEDDEYEASIFEPVEPLHEAEPERALAPEPLAKAPTEEVFSTDTQIDTSTLEDVPAAPLDDLPLGETSFDDIPSEGAAFENEAQPLLADVEPVVDDLAAEELTDFNAPLEFDVSGEVDPLADETLDELDKLGLSLDLDADVNEASEDTDTDVGLQLAYDADAIDSHAQVDANSAAPVDESDSSSFVSEVGTKLDLARAYIDMGDFDGAREILDEVLQEGSDLQRTQATEMLTRIA